MKVWRCWQLPGPHDAVRITSSSTSSFIASHQKKTNTKTISPFLLELYKKSTAICFLCLRRCWLSAMIYWSWYNATDRLKFISIQRATNFSVSLWWPNLIWHLTDGKHTMICWGNKILTMTCGRNRIFLSLLSHLDSPVLLLFCLLFIL